MPHKTYATWEPPIDADDDKPILPSGDVPRAPVLAHDTMRVGPLPLPDPTSRDTEPPSERDDPDFAQIFINVGRRDGARPSDFQKVLVEAAGLAPADTGRIRVRDRNTFVSVRKESLDRVVAALVGQVIAGRSVLAEPAKQRIS